MTNEFDTLLWDVDNTLLDFERSMLSALKRCFDRYALKEEPGMFLRYGQINQSYWKRLERGEVDKQTLLRARFTDFFAEYGLDDVDVEAFQKDYQHWLGCDYYFLEHSDLLLRKLKDVGMRQFFVTNGVAETQRNKLERSGLSAIADGLFISEELGAEKPDRAFFDACFAQIASFDRRKTLLVGDSLTSDIQGAANAGIAACWYHPSGEENESALSARFEIKSLWEIPQICGFSEIKLP